ncbi:hypothetical protein QTG54_007738 [Skeletonema marinoi]|uniref:Uncharacterized protein n=1 Tax=Skeletonema marinoi TaxID=267567 RepID=A0AAD8YA33_9STRA|nr:hypothetical protein QTG54_007738 [Skeletonema marinoi]
MWWQHQICSNRLCFRTPGTGKSFTGDYMTVMHDYHHVDGDIPLKHMCLVPEYKEMAEKMFIEGDWEPYFSELARLTLEGAKDNDKVVLSHATDKNEMRDHVIKQIIEGGASEDKITIIQLTIDPKVKARGLYHRTARMAEQSGMTMTECCKAFMEFEGEMTEEKWINMTLEAEAAQPEDGFEVHPKAIMVDISGRDVTHFDNVDKALGLTRSTEVPYESICAKVKPIDEARDKKVMESGFMEAFVEIIARAEAQNGQSSSLAIEEEDTSEEVEARRKSLITTGKICEE